MSTTETEAQAVIATLDAWAAAVRRADIQSIMEHYTDDVLAFDAIQSLQFKGAQAYGAHWKACMEMCAGPGVFEVKDPTARVAGDFATVYGLLRCGMIDEKGVEQASWMRMTTLYRRVDGRWLIEHEHFSAPIDMKSWKAMFGLQPDSPNAVQPVPTSMSTITPHLVCEDAAGAIEFYKKAFGAQEENRLLGPDGKIAHACLRIGDATVFLTEQNLEWGAMSPRQLNGSPITIHLYVRDVDDQARKLEEAGAKAMMPVQDTFWGDRYGVYEDPYGHRWSIATHVRDLSAAEIEEAGRKAMTSGEMCGADREATG